MKAWIIIGRGQINRFMVVYVFVGLCLSFSACMSVWQIRNKRPVCGHMMAVISVNSKQCDSATE